MVGFSNVDMDSWLVNAFTQTEGEHDTHVTEYCAPFLFPFVAFPENVPRKWSDNVL